ncbi:hypothetical protein Lal_00021487 [Lupinus albus]|nr:hypothetical protein Lal_00021487 [Lupinus albus]
MIEFGESISIITKFKLKKMIDNKFNDYVLSKIPVDMSDINDSETFNILTLEFLISLATYGLPNHNIKLKVGTLVMLLRNLDQYEGLCNGTRLVVTKMTNHVLEAKIMSGKNNGNIIYIHRLSMSLSQSLWTFTLIRRQFPIIVSYVMTINKSRVICGYFQSPNKKGLKILIHDNDGKPLKSTTNVVYKEVFQNL